MATWGRSARGNTRESAGVSNVVQLSTNVTFYCVYLVVCIFLY